MSAVHSKAFSISQYQS